MASGIIAKTDVWYDSLNLSRLKVIHYCRVPGLAMLRWLCTLHPFTLEPLSHWVRHASRVASLHALEQGATRNASRVKHPTVSVSICTSIENLLSKQQFKLIYCISMCLFGSQTTGEQAQQISMISREKHPSDHSCARGFSRCQVSDFCCSQTVTSLFGRDLFLNTVGLLTKRCRSIRSQPCSSVCGGNYEWSTVLAQCSVRREIGAFGLNTQSEWSEL